MSDEHKPLGDLPEEWVCKQCGNSAAQYACVCSRSELNVDDAATVAEYGTGVDQFADEMEIEICGYCGDSHWQAPAPAEETNQKEGV